MKINPDRRMVVKIAIAAALATMLSGCVVSFINPLPASQPVGRDDRLLGKWEGQDEHNNPVSTQFEPGSKSETKVSVSGSLGHQNPIFRMVTTKISGNDYMILRLNDPQANKDYMVVRYSISDDKLTVCLLNVDRVKEAIKKRKLKGQVDYSQWGGAIVTEGSRGVVAFLRTATSKDLFTCLPELKKATSK